MATEYITMPMAVRMIMPSRMEALEWARQLKKRWYKYCEENKQYVQIHIPQNINKHIIESPINDSSINRAYKALPSVMVHKFLCDNWEWGRDRIRERFERNCETMKQRLAGNFTYVHPSININVKKAINDIDDPTDENMDA